MIYFSTIWVFISPTIWYSLIETVENTDHGCINLNDINKSMLENAILLVMWIECVLIGEEKADFVRTFQTESFGGEKLDCKGNKKNGDENCFSENNVFI